MPAFRSIQDLMFWKQVHSLILISQSQTVVGLSIMHLPQFSFLLCVFHSLSFLDGFIEDMCDRLWEVPCET